MYRNGDIWSLLIQIFLMLYVSTNLIFDFWPLKLKTVTRGIFCDDPLFFSQNYLILKNGKKNQHLSVKIVLFLVGIYKNTCFFMKILIFAFKMTFSPLKKEKRHFLKKSWFFHLTVTCFAKTSKTYSRKYKNLFFRHMV